MLAVICGADSFVAIALFGQLSEVWLCTLLALPHGIPSHDTSTHNLLRQDPSFKVGIANKRLAAA